MKHYDQNMIELYVLGSEKVKGVRDELEQHLKECYTWKPRGGIGSVLSNGGWGPVVA